MALTAALLLLVPVPAAAAVTLRWRDYASNGCVAFRETDKCTGTGPRKPEGDRDCDAVVPCGVGLCPSGYCECADGSHVHPVDCLPGTHAPFKCADYCPRDNGTATERVLELNNGFASVLVNVARPGLEAVFADLGGALDTSNLSAVPSVLTGRWQLETVDTVTGAVAANPGPAQLVVVSNNSALAHVRLSGVVDDAQHPRVQETWDIALAADARMFTFNTTGAAVAAAVAGAAPTAAAPTAAAEGDFVARHSVGFAALSIYALFDSGVVQMLNADGDASFFCGTDVLPTVYGLGGGTAFDLRRTTTGSAAGQTALLSHAAGSGLQTVLVGAYGGKLDTWTGPPKNFRNSRSSGSSSSTAAAWSTSTSFAPNNFNFPSHDLTTQPNLPHDDLEALMTGSYGSSPGCLCTYPNEVKAGKHVAQIATTIARPDRGYSGTYNYFDPDNYISLTGMMYSGDPYLLEQARQVIERSGAFLKPNGQLPHHFQDDVPTYTALSGATQTGPNTFWTKAGLQYARLSGNSSWLRAYAPTLRKAAGFCFNLIINCFDGHKMLDAPGSLMIDVFIRQHFTADSNAMIVGFLREFAEVEAVVGNASGADALYALADQVQRSVDELLWARPGVGRGGDDHYVTQLNPDNTTRDFVDYDGGLPPTLFSNLIAVAHGIPDKARAAKILQRIDQGRCAAASGGGPQFVSEVYYGPDDTTHGNIGDSWTAMGRIALFDGHARKYVGDEASLASFDNHILGPIQRDLIASTWMHERYACDGHQMDNRTAMYFEYPSTVAMLLREIRYGISVGLTNVTVDPFRAATAKDTAAFNYHVGTVNVDYDPTGVVKISVPGDTTRLYRVLGLKAGRTFDVTCVGAGCAGFKPAIATSDAMGTVEAAAPVGVGATVVFTPHAA